MVRRACRIIGCVRMTVRYSSVQNVSHFRFWLADVAPFGLFDYGGAFLR
jgi:hypothetical protein